MNNYKNNPEDNIYLLSFIDLVDRLDILFLEIRHLQQTIIYLLRSPTLYLPLRYEEDHIFGDNWGDKLKNSSGVSEDIVLIKEWLIRYPYPDFAVQEYVKNKRGEKDSTQTERDKIKNRVKHRVGQLWMGDNWVRDQRVQYYILYALQLLKHRILRDKVALYKAAMNADILSSSDHPKLLKKPAFMVLRQSILNNTIGYIDILRNNKQQISQAIDFGMPSDPQPSTEHRREMGIFMDFLSNRTQDIHRDILHIIKDISKGSESEEIQNSRILMMHGWSHSAAVTSQHLFDKTNYLFDTYCKDKPKDKSSQHHVGYINTSFWAPDRPDLHPFIAHEIAKTVVDNVMGGLDDVTLSNNSDSLTLLLVNLKRVLLEYALEDEQLAFLKEESGDIIKVLACDFLAATAKGISYLYSLFLLHSTDGLENQLKVSGKTRLEMVYYLSQGTSVFDHTLLNYLRIQLTIVWLKTVIHKDASSIDNVVLEGCEKVSAEMLDFLDNYSPPVRRYRADSWVNLKDSLAAVISNAVVTRECKNWRKQRSHDDWKESSCEKGRRMYARTTRRLNIRLQDYLFRELLAQKRKKSKLLAGRDIKSCYKDFHKFYGLEVKPVQIPHVEPGRMLHKPDNLFRHMYDIPYQSSLLRSIDILDGKPEYNDFFTRLRWDMELGRGLFAVALEFYAREAESPEHRLSLCINLVSYFCEDLGNNQLSKALYYWLDNVKKDNYHIDLVKEYESEGDDFLDDGYMTLLCDQIKNLSAVTINTVYSLIPFTDTRVLRRVEKLAGFKLCELLDLLKKELIDKANSKVANKSQLHALIQFLSIRRDLNIGVGKNEDNSEKNPKGSSKTDFYNHLLASLGDVPVAIKNEYEGSFTLGNQVESQQLIRDFVLKSEFLPSWVPDIMVSRLSISNYPPVSHPLRQRFDVEEDDSKNHNLNGFSLFNVLAGGRWASSYELPLSMSKKGQPKKLKSSTWVTLGRYDAIVMQAVRLPCRCILQSFTSDQELPFKEGGEQISDEKFPPFFSRREVAKPFLIIDGRKREREDPRRIKVKTMLSNLQKELFVMLGVTLQRRSMRLDFLFRLIRAVSSEQKEEWGGNVLSMLEKFHSPLERSICKLKEKGFYVYAFLTDGGGDIIFTFSKEKEGKQGCLSTKEDSLTLFLDFQKAVYEDFMVDRTEITYTPCCIDIALSRPQKYNVMIYTRLREDRWLENTIDMFTTTIEKLNVDKGRPAFIKGLKYARTPWRSDFRIELVVDEKVCAPSESYKEIINWLAPKANGKSNINNIFQMLSSFEMSIEKI
ncbi:MAG: hypothetical protein KAH22_02440 [Thiotrichaceae bacterium]|nr:hypothetical protein [Thiotrichaceae bacterium]